MGGLGRAGRGPLFGPLLEGHELFVCFVTVAEVMTFLRLGVLTPDSSKALSDGLRDYATLAMRLDDALGQWVAPAAGVHADDDG